MYRLTEEEFLTQISRGLKSPLLKSDIFTSEIKLSHLKRIDKIFEKGLHYYLDPKTPDASGEDSIFFRKSKFVTDELTLGAVKIVNKFEDTKLSLEALATLSEIEFTRNIRKFTTSENPQRSAIEIRQILYPSFVEKRRDFLKLLISKLAEKNILVFEFIETYNKKEKANIDGFFLKPNFIVLKRYPSFRREIFTLAHELGHYLLDKEEIEKIEYDGIADTSISRVERWCNDFAFAFLAGTHLKTLDALSIANSTNDYHINAIEDVSKKTHLSEMAIFTRLLYQKQISPNSYNNVRSDYEERFRIQQEEKEREKQLSKEQGIQQRGSSAKPIPSPLFILTIQTAFYEGILSEYEVSKRLNIKPEKLEKYIP